MDIRAGETLLTAPVGGGVACVLLGGWEKSVMLKLKSLQTRPSGDMRVWLEHVEPVEETPSSQK